VVRTGTADRPATPARRSASAAANAVRVRAEPVSASTVWPVSGSTSMSWPTSGSSASRGSVISIAVTVWRCASVRSGACQPSSRKSETTVMSPRVRARRWARSSAAASGSSGAAASGATPAPTSRRSAANARRPERGGSTAAAGAPAVTAATRPAAAHGEPADGRGDALGDVGLQRCPVPNAIEALTSTITHVVSARSGTCWRTWGMPVRALAAGSRWRGSSPGS
jgi:hypothetical protein